MKYISFIFTFIYLQEVHCQKCEYFSIKNNPILFTISDKDSINEFRLNDTIYYYFSKKSEGQYKLITKNTNSNKTSSEIFLNSFRKRTIKFKIRYRKNSKISYINKIVISCILIPI